MSEQTAANPAQTQPETTRKVPLRSPVTDIYETRDALVLLMELPGVDASDVEIAVDNRVLTVTGRTSAKAPPGCTLVHAEYRDADYQRAFTLSDAVDPSRIDAVAADGVLRLTVPKAAPEPARRIAVRRA